MKSYKEILSAANKINCMKLLSFMKSANFFGTKVEKKAGVLVPLCIVNEELSLLYTVRALHLKNNGGDIAFPGGMFNDSDGSIEQTALRETYEEIGINQDQVDIWGKGPEIQRQDVKVTPVLAYIGNLDVKKLKINSSEVELAFPATIESLCLPRNFRVTRFRTSNNFIYQTPVYIPAHTQRIWGLTAYITHMVLSCLVPDTYKKNIHFNPTFHKVMQAEQKCK